MRLKVDRGIQLTELPSPVYSIVLNPVHHQICQPHHVSCKERVAKNRVKYHEKSVSMYILDSNLESGSNYGWKYTLAINTRSTLRCGPVREHVDGEQTEGILHFHS